MKPSKYSEIIVRPHRGIAYKESPNKGGFTFIDLHYSADPDSDTWDMESMKGAFPTKAHWDMEMEMNPNALGGQRVFPDFDKNIHVVEDSMVPQRGCIYNGLDPHPRTPHAWLWILVDRYNDYWVYRELWPSKQYNKTKPMREDEEDYIWSIKEYCDIVARLEGNDLLIHRQGTDQEYARYRQRPSGERIINRYMDQAGKGFRASGEKDNEEITYAQRYRDYGFQFLDPIKSHGVGYDAIHHALKLRNHEIYGPWPRLHIARSVVELPLELERYKFPAIRGKNQAELKQTGKDYRCHMIDLLRYLLTSNRLTYSHALESGRLWAS
jgi:hypothetical protein